MKKINLQGGRRRWAISLAAVAVVVTGAYLVYGDTGIFAQGLFPGFGRRAESSATSSATSSGGIALATVPIESADLAALAVSASGNLDLIDQRSVALKVDGIVDKVAVKVGDSIKAGDLLLQLDTTDLERALAQAQLKVDSAKIALADLKTPATAADIAKAQAALMEAKENLADVKAGPSAEEVAAARSSLAAAQSSYSELKAGPTQDELTQKVADLKKAEIAVADAQRAYDRIAWQSNAGMSSEASALQEATIDYESTKAAYDQATATATNSEVQSAVSTMQTAQVKLNDLLNSPTAAEIATAEASVATAEAALADLQAGPSDADLKNAEVTLKNALIDLESAQRNLAAATLTAPIDGVVMTLDATEGVRSGSGTVVATLADPSQLQLEISVAEADIPNVSLGQTATVEVDALPGKTFNGAVSAISPINDSSSSSVNYPVTVKLTSKQLTGVKPGMNAVATLENSQTVAPNSWLVPTNALRTNGAQTVVMVVRDGQPTPVSVTTGTVQGEWTMVQSPELQAGDEVVGSLTSKTNQQNGFFGPPPDMGGGGPQGPRN